MKHCTVYGCAAVAPRNSKVCIEHIRLGFLEHGFEAAPLEVRVGRGASSFTMVNRTGLTLNMTLTCFSDGQLKVGVNGGGLSKKDLVELEKQVAIIGKENGQWKTFA